MTFSVILVKNQMPDPLPDDYSSGCFGCHQRVMSQINHLFGEINWHNDGPSDYCVARHSGDLIVEGCFLHLSITTLKDNLGDTIDITCSGTNPIPRLLKIANLLELYCYDAGTGAPIVFEQSSAWYNFNQWKDGVLKDLQ